MARAIDRLKGIAQTISNMMKRDGIPVRVEAADELRMLVAEVEGQLLQATNKSAIAQQKLEKAVNLLLKLGATENQLNQFK